MPEAYVHTIKGRPREQKRVLIHDITAVVVRNFGVAAAPVLVEIIGTSKDNQAKGGVLFSERQAQRRSSPSLVPIPVRAGN